MTAATQTTPIARAWSAQQQAIFEWYQDGAGNLIVRARAGTGKTTTIIEAVGHAPERDQLLAAFNKRIAEELTRRIKRPGAVAKTLHSVGFGLVRREWPKAFIGQGTKRAWSLAEQVCGVDAPKPILSLVSKLHSKAREIKPHATAAGSLVDLAVNFELEPDEDWCKDGFDLAYIEARALEAMQIAAREFPGDTGIDFADMIYLPVRNRWMRQQYELVTVDEAQDMTVAQLEIAVGVCGGRVVLVGDDRQAIYGFRGADSGSLDRLKRELKATELGLTVTYRCGKAITALAAKLVPGFTAAPTNPPGEVRTILSTKLVEEVQPGDFVLSRKNAPLMPIAMSLIRQQRRVRVAGRDIGSGLMGIVKTLTKDAPAHTIEELLDRLAIWTDREVTRAFKGGHEERVEQVRDQSETLAVLCESVNDVWALERRINSLFTDDIEAGAAVVCSSVHKAKGLETSRVFILKDTLLKPTDKGGLEELNIEYVAVTRAQHVLTWVIGEPAAAAVKPAKGGAK